MKKIIIIFFIVVFALSNFKSAVLADDCPTSRATIIKFADDENTDRKDGLSPDTKTIEYIIKVADRGSKYKIFVDGKLVDEKYADSSFYIRGIISKNTNQDIFIPKKYSFSLERDDPDPNFRKYCQIDYEILPVQNTPTQSLTCNINPLLSSKDVDNLEFTPSTSLSTNVDISIKGYSDPSINKIIIEIIDDETGAIVKKITKVPEIVNQYSVPIIKLQPGQTSVGIPLELGKLSDGIYRVKTYIQTTDYVCPPGGRGYGCTTKNFESFCELNTKISISTKGGKLLLPSPTPSFTPTPTIPAICGAFESYKAQERGDCGETYKGCPWCITPIPKRKVRPTLSIPDLKPLCEQLDPKFQDECKRCVNPPKGGIWSAIGCLPTDFSILIKDYVFKYGVGIAGGIAFLYFLYGAFMILTSSGNAEKMEEAKQIITSSLAGLLLIIFSIFLLKTIGVDIPKLPGFG